MKILTIAVILGYFSLGESYTKYGRSCKDIGCPSNQQCVMETDPCSYQRQSECGSYPTCKKISDAARTCTTYVCPPTKACKMDGDTPKCVDDHIKGLVAYDTHNQNTLGQQDGPPSNLYPSIPRGETTPRPNVNQRPVGGGGYQGGQVGSGYPGQGGGYQGGYPGQGAGYPGQGSGYQGGYPGGTQPRPGGYPQQQGYPQGYPQGAYQGQGGYQPYPGYNGYQQQGYPQGGYNQQGQNRYGQKSSGSSFTDKLTDSLKSIGLFCVLLKYFASRIYEV